MKTIRDKKNKKSILGNHYPILILIVLFVVLITALFFIVLHNKNKADIENEGILIPSRADGYFDSSQTVYGGDSVSNVSINSLSISSEKQDELFISIDFKEENTSTQVNTVLSSVVPLYSVNVIDQPYRLMIRMENVTEWEFTAKKSWLDYSLLNGAFVAPPTNENNDNPTLVFQLSDDIVFRTEEMDGKLSIYLKKIDTKDSSNYFVLINGITNLKEAQKLGMTPCLCSDAVHILMISQGFETEEAAQSYIRDNASLFNEILPGKELFIEKLNKNKLPQYPVGIDEKEMAAIPIIAVGGVSKSLPIFKENIVVLSVYNNEVLCAVPYYSASSSSISYLEQLYVLNRDNNAFTPFDDSVVFHTILVASYSPDGKQAALIDFDSDENQTTLYIINLKEKTISEVEILKDCFIYDFIWCSNDSLLIISQDNESVSSLQLISLNDKEPQLKLITTLESNDGMIGFHDDVIFFSETVNNTSRICTYNLTDDTINEFMPGLHYYIVSDQIIVEEKDQISVYDLSTKELLDSCRFNKIVSSSSLLNTDRILLTATSENNESINCILIYDPTDCEFSELCKTVCNDVHYLSDTSIVINSFYATQLENIPVAYLFDFND